MLLKKSPLIAIDYRTVGGSQWMLALNRILEDAMFSRIAIDYRTVGGSQWMLALNRILEDAMFSTQVWKSNNGPT
jgi:hypothetical protein